MSAHHDELQDIENIKDFWKRGGKWLFTIILAAALGYWFYTIYQNHIQSNNAHAATIASKIKSTDLTQLQQLQNDHPNAFATAHATLNISTQLFHEGQFADAAKGFQWILDHHQDALLQATAAQNLAIVALQQKHYEEALKFANTPVDGAFQALLDEVRGDIYLEQGKTAEAKAAYQSALKNTNQQAPNFEQLSIKANAF